MLVVFNLIVVFTLFMEIHFISDKINLFFNIKYTNITIVEVCSGVDKNFYWGYVIYSLFLR